MSERDVLDRYQNIDGPNCCLGCVGAEQPCDDCREGLAVADDMADEIRRLRAEVERLRTVRTPTDDDIEAIADDGRVGYFPGAWDMVDPCDLITACWIRHIAAIDEEQESTNA